MESRLIRQSSPVAWICCLSHIHTDLRNILTRRCTAIFTVTRYNVKCAKRKQAAWYSFKSKKGKYPGIYFWRYLPFYQQVITHFGSNFLMILRDVADLGVQVT